MVDDDDRIMWHVMFQLPNQNVIVEYTYDHPKQLPGLQSSTIAWEQSVVEGHATHPVSHWLRLKCKGGF